jgi:tetratricopeptide (TPR) repeat protein
MNQSPIFRTLRFPALAALVLAASCLSLPAGAQNAQAGGAKNPNETKQKVTPTIRYEVGEKFNKAAMCMDEEDYMCVTDNLDDVAKVRDLNSYEQGQLWNMRAYMYYGQDDTAKAIDAYEHIRALPKDELPDGLVQSAIRNLAVLYLSEEDYEKGLTVYLEFMALPTVTPSDDDYALLAQIYYSMNRYADGVPAIKKAIELAKAKGELGDENWYVLLYFFQYQLDQRDEAVGTLTTLVQNWTKKNHVLQLAGELSEHDRNGDTLTLYEALYAKGWFTKSSEYVQLGNLYLNAGAPFQAASVLQKGLDKGEIESTVANWRLLAQAWQQAKDDEKALPALRQASKLAEDGEPDLALARSLAKLAKWSDCADAAGKAIDRGVKRTDSAQMQLGQCLLNMRRYPEARDAFQSAIKDAGDNESGKKTAQSFLKYVNDEIERERRNKELLDQVKAQGV